MSLFGSLNIGVAGLAANSAALSATSSNIANVNTVGYKEATTNFSTFMNAAGIGGGASAGVTAVIGQDVTAQGLPITTSSPTDLSISMTLKNDGDVQVRVRAMILGVGE